MTNQKSSTVAPLATKTTEVVSPEADNATNLTIIRIGGEMTTKAPRTRQRYQQAMRRNLVEALNRNGIAHSLDMVDARLLLRTEDRPAALGVLPRVFGLGSFSPVEAITDATVEAIIETGREFFTDQVRGKRYAVRCKRIGPRTFSTLDVERQLGAALNDGATVDLTNPEITVRIEVFGGHAYLFAGRHIGASGLPPGIHGRTLALISGGFDSAVAAWRLMRRGAAVDYLFCNLGGLAYEGQVLQVTKVLTEAWGFGQSPRLYVVDFTAPVADIQAHARSAYWQVVLKRYFYRAACQIAAETGAEAIITGEALGQVSSQTLANLRAIDGASNLPVYRPLIGLDKQEIVDQARHIGTAPLSEKVKEYCAISPKRPVTAVTPEKLDAQEVDLDRAILVDAVAARREINLDKVNAIDLRAPYLFADEIPEGAVVMDFQPRHMFEAWHVPGASNRDPAALIESYRRLDKDKTYILYCTFGTQTPVLAELMQQAGFDAYAFRGGISRVRRHAGAEALNA